MKLVGAGAINAAKTECAHGHPFSPENTRLVNYGQGHRRICKTCHRERRKRQRSNVEFSRIEYFKKRLRKVSNDALA